MKVKELIALLSKVNMDTEIIVDVHIEDANTASSLNIRLVSAAEKANGIYEFAHYNDPQRFGEECDWVSKGLVNVEMVLLTMNKQGTEIPQ